MIQKSIALALIAAMLICVFAVGPVTVHAEAMKSSQEFIDILKEAEGFRSKPYKDNGHYSIGYGSVCPDNMVDYYTKNPITEKQAEKMMMEHLAEFEDGVNQFAQKYGLTLQQHQFDALVSFSYNCGDRWMRETDGYFHVAVREGSTGADLMYGMGLWSTSAGKYILINRRMRELNMFINGVYTKDEGQDSYPENFRWVFLDGGAGTVTYKICVFDTQLKAPLNVAFKQIPVGKDSQGKAFAYTLAGWYTEDGRKVEILDETLERGQNLYAKWADPEGNIVTPPEQVAPESVFPKTGTVVNVKKSVSVRTGPGRSYEQDGSVLKDARVTVLEEVKGGDYGVDGKIYNTWGRIDENKWVATGYIRYDENTVTDLQLVQLPTKTDYVQPVVSPKLEGSVLLATYSNGYSEALTVKKDMISGFDGTKTGQQTVTASYGGKTVTFPVSVSAATPPAPTTVTSDVYTIADGVLTGVTPGTTAAQLLEGIHQKADVKLVGASGELAADAPVGTGTKVVFLSTGETACTVVIRGDVNEDGILDGRDATLLLQHIAQWDVSVNPLAADVDGNGITDGRDATLLLQYTAGWDITITQ